MNLIDKNKLGSNPKVLLVGGLDEKWSANELNDDQKNTNGVEAWAIALNADYCAHHYLSLKVVSNYDIIICNTNGIFDSKYLNKYLPIQLNRPQNLIWISLLEGNMADYIIPSEKIKEVFDSSDLINCINRNLTNVLQSFTKTPVRFIGIPYPVDSIKKYRKQIHKRNKKIFICPMLLNRRTDHSVAMQTGLPYYGYERILLRKWRTLIQNYNLEGTILNKYKRIDRVKSIYNDPKLEILSVMGINEYYEYNSNAYLWISMDNRFTWARYVLDAAALGIPIITTSNTGHGEILFPKTTLDNEYDIKKAGEIALSLIDDTYFYNEVIDFSDSQLEQYKPEYVKCKLLGELDKLL